MNIHRYVIFGTLQKGFTLIEMILYIGLSTMIIVTMLNVILTITTVREKSQTISTVQQELRLAMDQMSVIVRDALDINIAGSAFGTDNGILSLTMSGGAFNPTIFSRSGNRIYRKQGASPALPITSSGIIVDILRFTNLSAPGTNGTVRILLHGIQEDDALSLETSISLRQ